MMGDTKVTRTPERSRLRKTNSWAYPVSGSSQFSLFSPGTDLLSGIRKHLSKIDLHETEAEADTQADAHAVADGSKAAIVLHAERIDRKDVRAPLVVERVENEADVVVREGVRVPLGQGPEPAGGARRFLDAAEERALKLGNAPERLGDAWEVVVARDVA